jgi:hypothetical protein
MRIEPPASHVGALLPSATARVDGVPLREPLRVRKRSLVARQRRPPRPRTLQRRQQLLSEKLAQARRKLLDLEPGGTPDHPAEVGTPAVIEPMATSIHCPACDEPFGLESHEAHADGRLRLREARVRCRACGEHRSLWFRVNVGVFAAN